MTRTTQDAPTDGPSGAGENLPGVATGAGDIKKELNTMARLAQAVVDARDAYEDADGGDSEIGALHACEAAERDFFDATGPAVVERLRELEAVAEAATWWIVASRQAAKVRWDASRGAGASPIELAEIERLDRQIVSNRAEFERLLHWRVRRAQEGDPCCERRCPDMATHIARTGVAP